ncbi:hypothetical protein IMSAG025_02011 [Muribaculaceae bacterium]|nr:hypothetical protein IMSAG025_02011 [Muribaculaceae bacterium]
MEIGGLPILSRFTRCTTLSFGVIPLVIAGVVAVSRDLIHQGTHPPTRGFSVASGESNTAIIGVFQMEIATLAILSLDLPHILPVGTIPDIEVIPYNIGIALGVASHRQL